MVGTDRSKLRTLQQKPPMPGSTRHSQEPGNRVATVVNTAMVQAYWNVGRQIVEAQGERAEYGKRLLHYLAQGLTAEFGPGFDESNLRNMRRFYAAFPIQETLSPELTWSHYNVLAKVPDPAHREFYTREAVESGWTVRQLRRQTTTMFYERLLASRNDQRDEVSTEITQREPRTGADDLLKDPYVFEFLDIAEPRRYLGAVKHRLGGTPEGNAPGS